ncbi:MAG: hypothetical protein R3D25_17880 [Geminicoccaceae bacterium]
MDADPRLTARDAIHAAAAIGHGCHSICYDQAAIRIPASPDRAVARPTSQERPPLDSFAEQQ